MTKKDIVHAIKYEAIMEELKMLGNDQIKRIYINHGAKEPLFGVKTKALKGLQKKIKKHHEVALQLYASGNYDAMYFAGMIVDTTKMQEADIEEWMQGAYCQGIADYVVANTLAKLSCSQTLAYAWIHHESDLYRSAGWSCYAIMLGYYPDTIFDLNQIQSLLQHIQVHIHTSMNHTKYAMNAFVIAVGISYLPLHEQALQCAYVIDEVTVDKGNTSCKTPLAYKYIEKAISNHKIGYKRKNLRC